MAYQNFYNPYPNQNYQNPYYQQPANNMQFNYSQQQQSQPQIFTQQQQSYQPSNSGFQWVQGEAAAKAFHVDPGQTVLLMDSDNPVLYYKSTDQSGRPIPMIIYDLVERKATGENQQEALKIDLSEYVKRSEIEEIIQNAVSKGVEKKMSEIKFTATTAPMPTIVTA